MLADPTNLGQTQAAVARLLPDVEVAEVVARTYSLEDPVTRGAWALLQPGQLTRYEPHRRVQPEGRIAFACDALAAGSVGFIDGAIETGIIAARHTREMLAAK